jgi:N-acetylmuramoyl-L-alanine amidase
LKPRPQPSESIFLIAIGLAASVLMLASRLAGQGAAPGLTLLTRDGPRPLAISVVSDQEFVALDELAAAFQLAVREEPGAVSVSYKGKTIVLTPDQTIASVAGRMISLPTRPVRSGGRLLVPIDFLSRAVGPIYDARIEVRRASHLVVVGDLRVPRVAIAIESLPVGMRLTIDASPQATSTLTRDGDQLLIKFDADALDTTLPAPAPQPFLQGLRRVDAVTLAVDLGPRAVIYRSSNQVIDTTARLSIELLPPATETAATPAPVPAAPAPPAPPVLPAADPPAFGQPTSAIRTVTIDPGHGGADEGARGVQGLLEKNLTLIVARRVKGLLEARLGLRVLLTRDDDRHVAFDDRAAVANNNKADLFISLHANASLKPGATGASILTAAFPDEARTRQELVPERVPVFGGGSRDIELVLWNQAQIRYIDQSAVFMRTLQERFQGRVPLDVRPTGRAPLRVLASTNMPAVLVDLGYLSNPEQERQLANGEFQGTVAQAILDAVVLFRDYLAHGAGAER